MDIHNAEGVSILVNGSVDLGTFNNGGQLGPVAGAATPIPTMGTIGIIALFTLMLGIGLPGVRHLV